MAGLSCVEGWPFVFGCGFRWLSGGVVNRELGEGGGEKEVWGQKKKKKKKKEEVVGERNCMDRKEERNVAG